MSIEDGGPAYPNEVVSNREDGPGFQIAGGMTLRDYFAAKAMQGLLAGGGGEYTPGSPGGVTGAKYIQDSAYRIADAMLLARKAQP